MDPTLWGLDIEAVRQWSSGVFVALCTAGALAAFIPLARNFGASSKIWAANKAKGKPTFRPGTQFEWVALPSGFEIGPCSIIKVDFFTVTLLERNSRCIVTLPKVVFAPCAKAVSGQTEAIESRENRS